MGNSRSKGKRGERKARELLVDYDYELLADTSDGKECEDAIVRCPSGTIYSVEIKNRKIIDMSAFRKQASKNAKNKKLPYLIMAKIEGSKSWLIWRQGEKPTVWSEK